MNKAFLLRQDARVDRLEKALAQLREELAALRLALEAEPKRGPGRPKKVE